MVRLWLNPGSIPLQPAPHPLSQVVESVYVLFFNRGGSIAQSVDWWYLMHLKKKLALTLVAGMALVAVTFAPAQAKTKAHKRTQSHHHRYGTYLVPPPPAYMPSILPELQASAATDGAEAPKPENPYKKYVYTKDGHDDPPPVQPNKYVTYWNKKS